MLILCITLWIKKLGRGSQLLEIDSITRNKEDVLWNGAFIQRHVILFVFLLFLLVTILAPKLCLNRGFPHNLDIV